MGSGLVEEDVCDVRDVRNFDVDSEVLLPTAATAAEEMEESSETLRFTLAEPDDVVVVVVRSEGKATTVLVLVLILVLVAVAEG